MAALDRRDGVEYAGLVLNERGLERLVATPLDRASLTLGVTETFNRRNGNASLDESVERARRMLERADRPTTVTLSVAWGDPWEGRVDPALVAEVAEQRGRRRRARPRRHDRRRDTRPRGRARSPCRVDSGSRSASTCTTRATPPPRTSGRRSRRVRRWSTPRSAVPAAARSRRASAGNVATEDVVYMLEEEGVSTGVDLDALIAGRRVARRASSGARCRAPCTAPARSPSADGLDHAGGGQLVHVGVSQADLAQHRTRVLPEQRRRATR